MSIPNFTVPDYENGNIIAADDLKAVLAQIHSIFDVLIAENSRSVLLPDGFAGENKLAAIADNHFFYISDGNVTLLPRQVFDDYVAAAATSASTALNAPGTSATSATNLTLGYGAKSLTLTQTGKTFSVGQFVAISNTTNPDLQWMTGGITAYNAVTGEMTVDVARFEGVGSNAAWTITLSAPASRASSTTATSTTTLTPVMGVNSFTIVEGGKDFSIGQYVTVADSTAPTTKYFNGAITAFNPSTRAMTVDAIKVQGGSSSSWAITASSPAQGEKFISPVQTFVNLGNVSGTVNIDLRVALKYALTLVGNTTITFTMPDLSSAATEVEAVLLITKSGSQTIAFPAGTKWHDGIASGVTTGGTDELIMTKQGSDNWIGRRGAKAIA